MPASLSAFLGQQAGSAQQTHLDGRVASHVWSGSRDKDAVELELPEGALVSSARDPTDVAEGRRARRRVVGAEPLQKRRPKRTD
jgi:hypothetical protein